MNSVHLTLGVLDVYLAFVQRSRYNIKAVFVVGFFDDIAKLLNPYVFFSNYNHNKFYLNLWFVSL